MWTVQDRRATCVLAEALESRRLLSDVALGTVVPTTSESAVGSTVGASVSATATATLVDSLPSLKTVAGATGIVDYWNGYDPGAESLETTVVRTWTEGTITFRYVVFTIGVFGGSKARLAAFYAFPKATSPVAAIEHIHGSGERASIDAVRQWALRGYAALSINWGGLTMEGAKSGDPNTSWGTIGSLYDPNAFENSPRNSTWFLGCLASRRGLTFLTQQAEVDVTRLGVYGHSMGAHMALETAGIDSRVKVAIIRDGGGLDDEGDTEGPVWGSRPYAARITCPVLFLSPSNDFFGTIDGVQRTAAVVQSGEVIFSHTPYLNHQESDDALLAAQLFVDHALSGTAFPTTPASTFTLQGTSDVFTISPDMSLTVTGVDVYYTRSAESVAPESRVWAHLATSRTGDMWQVHVPLGTVPSPLRVYANVHYRDSRTGQTFTISSDLTALSPVQLGSAYNKAPTNLTLPHSRIGENRPLGSWVGSFATTDPNAGNTFTYTLVGGTSVPDNALFSISGASLLTNARFNFERKSVYTIRVRVTDQGGLSLTRTLTVSIVNVNEAPTLAVLSSHTVAENKPAGTVVGTLSSRDPDAGNTFGYWLVTGAGDNSAFRIVGNQLRTARTLNYEARRSYSVVIRSTDQGRLFCDTTIPIAVSNVNERPTSLALSTAGVSERQPAGTLVGTFSTKDPDAGNRFTYRLVDGAGSADNGAFRIVGSQLRTALIFNYEARSRYSIRVRTADQGGLLHERAFTITVTNINEKPTALGITAVVAPTTAGDILAGARVGTLWASDPDRGSIFTYELVGDSSWPDNAMFAISGNRLLTSQDLPSSKTHLYHIRVRVTDQGGLHYDKTLAIAVT